MSKRVMQFARKTIAFAANGELFQRGRIMREIGIRITQRLSLFTQSRNKQADEHTHSNKADRANDGDENKNKNIARFRGYKINETQLQASGGDAIKNNMRQLIFPRHKRERNK